MKKFKLATLFLLGASLFTLPAIAQKPAECRKANCYSSLNISDAQRSQLQALDMRRDSVRRAARQEMNRQGREMKQRNDSSLRAARQAESRNYLEEVKAIVGPDQYVVFLEDFYVNSPAQGRGKAFSKEGRNGKDMKAAKVGDRGRKAYKDGKGKIARAGKDAKGRFAKDGKTAKDKAAKGVKDAKKSAKAELK